MTTFTKPELRTLYQGLSLAILMEETCAAANRGESWNKPDRETRTEIRRNLSRVTYFKRLQAKIAAGIQGKR